jgi:UDP-N-acetylmuramate dehydrogenase
MSNRSVSPADADTLTPTAADLTSLNTFGLAAAAPAYVRVTAATQLPTLSALARRYRSVFVLGGGSNVVLPSTLDGLVAHVGIPGIRLVEQRPDAWIVDAGGGENWHAFVDTCLRQGWEGLENLGLIPGTVGAAPVQNIGAYGVELEQRFLGLSAWDIARGEMVRMSAEECRFAYRDSRFKHDAPGRWLIVSVRFLLPRPWRPVLTYPDLQGHPGLAEADPDARAIFDAVCAIRRAKLPDPAVIGNAGSFFKNPVVDAGGHASLRQRYPRLVSYPQADGRYKIAAGWLIDQCGWKGRTLGAAGVHDRQALVLVNRGGARAVDILALADAIRADVRARFGVELEQEPVVPSGVLPA